MNDRVQLPMVTPADIDAAANRLAPYVRITPTVLAGNDLGLATVATLKLELLQHTGSFKARGAFNRILLSDIPQTGVIAASGGNHGAAVAFAAATLGLRAEIFVPSSSPAMKRDRIVALGGHVTVVDGMYDDAQAAAQARQRETGALAVHPFDDVDVVAGQGSMSRELQRQVPQFDTLLVATGGGGFIAGQAAWWQGRVKVVSVEPDTSCCLHAARQAGEPVDVEVSGRAADSLGSRRLGTVAWSVVRQYVAESVTVSDSDIAAAQHALWDTFRLVVEPGGAAAVAALRSGAYAPAPGERVVVVVCGANCDPSSVVN